MFGERAFSYNHNNHQHNNRSDRPREMMAPDQRARDVEFVRNLNQEDRIDERDFVDEKKEGYTARDIMQDQKNVAVMEEKFERQYEALLPHEIEKIKRRDHLSEALEVVVMSGGQKGKWFGEGSHLFRSARHDDIFNGVDGFLEFDMGDEAPFRMALAVDASMSKETHIIEKKMARGIKKIETGHMEVKYFKSRVDDFKGKLTVVVPIVLGIEAENAQKLVSLFANFEKFSEIPEKKKKLQQALENDPSQIIFLKEISAQLGMYAKLFRRNGSHIRYATEKMQGIIEDILESKNHIDSDDLEENDSVFNLITSISKEKSLEYQKK